MAIVVGVKTTAGTVLLKPRMDRPCLLGEGIIVIAEDDDTYDFVAHGEVACPPGPLMGEEDRAPQKMLICG